jgi:hypothetical protein
MGAAGQGRPVGIAGRINDVAGGLVDVGGGRQEGFDGKL